MFVGEGAQINDGLVVVKQQVDDYDLTSPVAFYVEKDKLLSINGSDSYTNIAKEGYYYQPHYKIKLREISLFYFI